jgi:hypothetical protein
MQPNRISSQVHDAVFLEEINQLSSTIAHTSWNVLISRGRSS